jgi:hypothetical protein
MTALVHGLHSLIGGVQESLSVANDLLSLRRQSRIGHSALKSGIRLSDELLEVSVSGDLTLADRFHGASDARSVALLDDTNGVTGGGIVLLDNNLFLAANVMGLLNDDALSSTVFGDNTFADNVLLGMLVMMMMRHVVVCLILKSFWFEFEIEKDYLYFFMLVFASRAYSVSINISASFPNSPAQSLKFNRSCPAQFLK